MAIYRFEAKVIGRGGRDGGRSVVACAAYRSGSSLADAKYEIQHDYTRRQAGIVYSEILAPADSPSWATDREKLWNEVESRENESKRHKNAQLAREFLPAIPVELTPDQRRELVVNFVKKEMVERGMVADVSIHEPKDGKNVHAHVLCTMRSIDAEGFGNKRRDWNETALLVHWREAWEKHCNDALKAAGSTERVDCRTLAAQGIDRDPQPKVGVAATAMERKGIPTERGRLTMWTKIDNLVRYAARGIERGGDVPQVGIGHTWWERAQVAIDWTTQQFGGVLRDESSGGIMPRRVAEAPEIGPNIAPGHSFWADQIMSDRSERRASEPEMGLG